MSFFQSIDSAYRKSDIVVKRQSDLSLSHNRVMGTLAERLRQIRADRGLSQKELARLSGVSQPTVSDIERGRNKGSTEIARLAEVLGVSAIWLAHGKGSTNTTAIEAVADHSTIRVPMFDAVASMGAGKPMPDYDTVIGALQLSETWVRTHLPTISNPRNLATLSAYGDSMAPTFADGDILLIDRGVCEVKLDAVYVLALNDELFVKRIQRRISGELVIKSDNPLYDPHVVENGEKETLKVLGRVVWAWNGKKL